MRGRPLATSWQGRDRKLSGSSRSLVFNRTIYRQSVGRPEFDKTGVYILVGTTEGSSLPTLYIGEGDPVKSRLRACYEL